MFQARSRLCQGCSVIFGEKCAGLKQYQSSLFFSFQECFLAKIHTVYLLKPDGFWESRRTSFGSSKLLCEVRRHCFLPKGYKPLSVGLSGLSTVDLSCGGHCYGCTCFIMQGFRLFSF